LLTGRVRDLDRNQVLDDLLPFLQAGSGRKTRDVPLFIVATQCIEAGADLDFDALVTEIAPLNSLRQRFGRLNRMGRDIPARAAIIASASQIAKSAKADQALQPTWALLLERSQEKGKGKATARVIDFGVAPSESWFPGDLGPYLVRPKNSPVLLPSAIDLWSRTSPIPSTDPDVSLYLHGAEAGAGDVGIVWRADLEGENENAWIDRVRVCPPSTLESVAVPIGEARRWLRGAAMGDISDIESGGDEGEQERSGRYRRPLWWCGPYDEKTRRIDPEGLRVGDVIVVPASYGGCDRWGWDPRSDVPVSDIGDAAYEASHGRAILRLSPALLREVLASEGASEFSVRSRATEFEMLLGGLDENRDAEVVSEVEHYPGLPLRWRERLSRLGDRPLVLRDAKDRPLALVRRRRGLHATSDAVTENDESVRARVKPIRLDKHSQGVEAYARDFAGQAGLPPPLAEDVALAAYLHDAGKAHLNFKQFLYGGDELASVAGPALAKSGKLPDSPHAWSEVRRRSGLPKGARHELASLRFAEAHPRFAAARDPELVLWLIGTHHGYGRPFFPAPEWDWPGEGEVFEADLGDGKVAAKPARSLADLTALWVDMFVRLKQRYGPWGLTRLEAILRLADHRRSEAEQEEDAT
jgi:CRISPR-associated endonuclease/helicase Cas3